MISNQKTNEFLSKTKTFLTNNLWLLRCIIFSLFILVISGSVKTSVCMLASTVLYSTLSKHKFLKHVGIIPLVVSFLISSEFSTVISAILLLCIGTTPSKKENTAEWTAKLTLPVALFLIIEFLQKNVKVFTPLIMMDKEIIGTMVCHYAYIYGISLIVIVATFFHLFFSKKVSWYITEAIFGLLGIVNFFVVAFTSQGFVPSDIKIAGTGFACLGTQALKPESIKRLVVGIILFVVFGVAVWLFYRKEQKDTRKIGQKASALTVVLVTLLLTNLVGPFFKGNLLFFNSNHKYGFITNFVVNFYDGLTFPNGLEEYAFEDADLEGDFKPNVIVIMSEGFSDLNGLYNLGGEDNLKYFNSLREKFPSGTAYSSVKGNNTCSSEWESLSGVSTALTAKGSIIYQDNCKYMNSLVNVFNRRGYYTVGLHPYFASGYNREAVYEAIGFQNSVFSDDFDEDTDKIRGYITDEENYLKIIDLYEQNGDKPFFCFNITMQNHGAYVDKSKDVIPMETTKHDDVNRYLSLINTSDEMLKVLIEYFEKEEEPTIILFFGDHQPAILDGFYEDVFDTEYGDFTEEQIKQIYQVPYLIWSNYELNEDAAPEYVSINYLSQVLFEVGNIPSTTWLEKLKEYRSEWPVVTMNFAEDKDGTFYTMDVAKTNETLNQYMMESYSILKGEENGD